MVGSLVRFLFTCCEESQTHSFAALTRSFASLHNLWIKIVRTHQPWSNLYLWFFHALEKRKKTKQNLSNKILGKLVENSECPRHALYGTRLSELFTPEPYKYRGKKIILLLRKVILLKTKTKNSCLWVRYSSRNNNRLQTISNKEIEGSISKILWSCDVYSYHEMYTFKEPNKQTLLIRQ